MDHKTEIIETLSDFLNIIRKEKYDHALTIYRGQNNTKGLLPKLFRDIEVITESLFESEIKMHEEFKKRARAILRVEPKNDTEWFAIAQHHGMQTRLLDWTQNALVALWFCVKEKDENNKEKKGVVYLLRSTELEIMDSRNFDKPFDLKFPKIYNPPFISERIIAQSGLFTVHSHNQSDKRFLPLEESEHYKPKIRKIFISYDNFDEIKKELKNCGIHSATLFPDLDGLCEYVNFEYLTNEEKLRKYISHNKLTNSK